MIHRIHLSETESTNSYLKELLTIGASPDGLTLVDADYQTGGRGQKGNHWESSRGENLTFSLLCHPHFLPASAQFLISQATALAVWETLDSIVEGIKIKWPNDIYWNDSKICGILIESDLKGSTISDSIIGVGLNVNQTVFHSDAPNPISLAQIIGFSLNRENILQSFTDNFEKYYGLLEKGCWEEVRSQYKSHLYRSEGIWCFALPDGEEFEAAIADIEPNGLLVLKHSDGELRKYEFKQIRWILNT